MSLSHAEGKNSLPKASSLAQIARTTFAHGQPEGDGLCSRRERLKQAMQRHSDLKKKYESLLQGKAGQGKGEQGKAEEEKVQVLAYTELDEAEYVHEVAPVLALSAPSPDFISILNGHRLEQFQIVRFFSEGISGKVYLAQNLRTRLLYSVKVIRRASLTPTNFQQLLREIKIQSFLRHPNVVRLYHTFADRDSLYLFLEPCLGGDLLQAVRRGVEGVGEAAARGVVKQVCEAVQYLHCNDIIHRDLKPENVLLHEGVAKVCDFGWAVHSPLLRETRCGTPLYVPPEMVKSELYDSKIDIWNIGVLTYELLFGALPFQIHHAHDITKIVTQDVYFPETPPVSPQARAFVLACLHKNPNKRIPIRQAIEHDFLRGPDRFRTTIA